jgi:hypothetical protein
MSDKSLLEGSLRLGISGWNYLHLEGDPYSIGYQHGFHMAREIKQTIDRMELWSVKSIDRKWDFYRDNAQRFFVHKIPKGQKKEVDGIAAGAKDASIRIDAYDVIALNGFFDSVTYHYWLKSQASGKPHPTTVGGCSAIVATGSATRTGEIIMAHNSWWTYIVGSTWNTIAHLKPTNGYEIVMQTTPGFIWSGTDWYIASSGLMIMETTYVGSTPYNPEGTPIFVRTREATQHKNTIEGWMDAVSRDNNGGYANDWHIGDIKTGEVGLLELGLEHQMRQKIEDGFLLSCNLALDPEVRKETIFDYTDKSTSATARYTRWSQLAEANTPIDIDMAKRFLADHFDVSYNKDVPSRNTLCGHVNEDARGVPEVEWGPNYPGGSLDGKVTTSSLASKGAFWAHWGKPCDQNFVVSDFLKDNPAYEWQRKGLVDIDSFPWILIEPGFEHPPRARVQSAVQSGVKQK